MSDPRNQHALATPRLTPLAPSRLPEVFRLLSIERLPVPQGCRHRAALFHEQVSLTVTWTSRHPDVTLGRGELVAVRWTGMPVCDHGEIRIARLVRVDRPSPTVNLFDTVPSSWLSDRDLLDRARALIAPLPRGFVHLFNAIFWDGKRFRRYLTGPSSRSGHHAERHGNFRHCVEVAEQALETGRRYGTTFPPVLRLGGLLHDAGKADEYIFDPTYRRFHLSERGNLIGHKQTVLEWVAAARAQHRVILPEGHYLALVHALTAAKGAPAWLGLRTPQSLDAALLSMADRLSGQADLHRQTAPTTAGFGAYHPHLGCRSYRADV